MSYLKKKKRSHGLDGLWDDIKGVATGAVDFYGKAKSDAGAAAALQQQQTAAVAVPVSSGMSTTTMLMLGAAGIGAIYLLKRKKS